MQPDLEPSDTADSPSTTRRLRLWQLPAASHALLIGLCLDPTELRCLTDRVFRGRTELDDARLLAGVVGECGTRNKVSEALQRAFDARFVHTVASFRSAKSPDALTALWQECLAGGKVGAGLWSASTHPCADEALQVCLCRDVQLLQFQAVSAMAAERRRVDELLLENGVLARELARVQQRQTRWHLERRDEQAELAALRLELIRARADIAARERLPDAEAAADRTSSLREQRLRGAVERVPAGASPSRSMLARTALLPGAPTSPAESPAEADLEAPSALPDMPVERSLVDAGGAARRILCVGGRTGHVPVYRALVEEQGGRFLHHDGGVEDNPKRLEAQLSAADLVICQTGCLSHNAYWRVKDHCKRTGTPCVYLDKPGAGSFLRGLVRGAPTADPVTGDSLVERPT